MNYEICGRAYPVIGHVTTRQTGRIPIVDLPMMADGRRSDPVRESAPVTAEQMSVRGIRDERR